VGENAFFAVMLLSDARRQQAAVLRSPVEWPALAQTIAGDSDA